MWTTGLLGKLPSQGDYLHHNLTDPISLAFDRWLQESHGAIAQARLELSPEPVRFLFSEPSAQNVLVGSLVGSRDQVGRKFPLSVFAVIPGDAMRDAYPVVHVAFERFFDAASHLLAAAERETGAALVARLASLPVPQPHDLVHAQTIGQQTLAQVTAHDFAGRLFGAPDGGHRFYAYHTFLTACRGAAGGFPDKTSTVLDCPVEMDVDLFAWLELSRRLLRWSTPPSFAWTEDAAPRLLLSLGPLVPQTFVFLTKPSSESAKLWPLRTERPAAIEAAAQSIAATAAPADAPGAPLGTLIDALTE